MADNRKCEAAKLIDACQFLGRGECDFVFGEWVGLEGLEMWARLEKKGSERKQFLRGVRGEQGESVAFDVLRDVVEEVDWGESEESAPCALDTLDDGGQDGEHVES